MKKIIIFATFLAGLALLPNRIYAQRANLSINLNLQPAWGPIGYDYVRYYYIPDLNCYYDVSHTKFIYFHRGQWVSARYLPNAYRNYDLYTTYKVVVNAPEPWRNNRHYYTYYAPYRGRRHTQVVIRDSRSNRYRNSRQNDVVWYSSPNNKRADRNAGYDRVYKSSPQKRRNYSQEYKRNSSGRRSTYTSKSKNARDRENVKNKRQEEQRNILPNTGIMLVSQ